MAAVADMRALTEAMTRTHEERFQEIAARRQATSDKLTLLAHDRVRDQSALQASLREDAHARMVAVADLRKDMQTEIVARANTIATELRNFERERTENNRQERAHLKDETERNAAEVKVMLGGFLAERSEATGIWQNYVASNKAVETKHAAAHEKHASANHKPQPAAAAKLTVHAPAIPERSHHAEISLEDRVFSFLAGHPDGVRFHDLEGEFHASRASVGHVVGELIAQNRARKDDTRNVYFAT